MDMDSIKKHWEALADKYGEGVQATTKTASIKQLEVNCLCQTIKNLINNREAVSVLEVGCGNGINCIELAKRVSGLTITGLDYVKKMVESAKASAKHENCDIQFLEGDVTKLGENVGLNKTYNIIFSNRCLINLNTVELQKKALLEISKKLESKGYYLMLENSIKSYSNQNELRKAVGLEERVPDAYNLFLEEDVVLPYAGNECGLNLIEINNFASLHDIMQYVIIPMQNNGKIIYGNELMETVTEFLCKADEKLKNQFGEFGQNRLYVFQKL